MKPLLSLLATTAFAVRPRPRASHRRSGYAVLSHLGTAIALSGLAWQAATAQTKYAEAQACATCHSGIAATYARTGMAQSFGTIGVRDPISKTKGTLFHHEASGEFFSTVVRNGGTYVIRHQLGFDGAAGNFLEVQPVYRIGSGIHAQSYLARNQSGGLVELPISWYSEMGGHWGMSPGYDRPEHAGFSRRVTLRCLFCHNAYPEIEAAANGQTDSSKLPPRLPEGIDCQRCHGPGSSHIQAVRNGASLDAVRRSIVNPARLDSARQMEVCYQCHLETTTLRLPASLVRYDRGVFSYRPGEPLENYVLHFDHAPDTGHDDKFEFSSAPYRLRKSACFLASRGALTCTRCHNPHDIPRGRSATAYYSQICRNCHGGDVAERARPGHHPAPDECVSCHMPKRQPSDAVHVTVTDHFIRKPQEFPPKNDLIERHDSNSPTYRGPVVLYYPESLQRTPENDVYLAVAQVKNQANLEQGIPRLEAAIARLPQKRPEFYLDLAEAYQDSGALEKTILAYQEACSLAPADWRPLYGLGMALVADGGLARSVKTLQRAVVLAPQEAAPLRGLAKALLAQGKLQEAVSALQKASALEPDSAEIRSDLGVAWLRLGNAGAAEKTLGEAIRLRPEIAAVHVNLAELLSRRKNFAESRFQFEAAIRLDRTLAEALGVRHCPGCRRTLGGGRRAIRSGSAYQSAALRNPQQPGRLALQARRRRRCRARIPAGDCWPAGLRRGPLQSRGRTRKSRKRGGSGKEPRRCNSLRPRLL